MDTAAVGVPSDGSMTSRPGLRGTISSIARERRADLR
jgi:hypothetical protein